MKKTAGVLLTLIMLLTAALVFFACDKTPEFAPNGICISENYVFFPEKSNNLHNAKLRTAFEKFYNEEQQPYSFDINSSYEIHNYVGKKVSKKHHIDIFEVRQESYSYFFLSYKDKVLPLNGGNTKKCRYYLTNFAITDIDNNGYIEILTSVSCIRKNGYYDRENSSVVRIYDSKTDYALSLYNYDFPTFFKEDENGVVTIYNAIYQPRFFDDVEDGIYDPLSFYYIDTKEYSDYVVFESPKLNTINFDFKQRSFEASCNLFNIVGTVNVIEDKFPYLFKDQSPYPIAFEIEFTMTYLGEPFSYVVAGNLPIRPSAKFVSDDKIIAPNMISSRWWYPPAKYEVVTGQKTVVNRNFFYVYEYLNAVGTYDLVISYDVDYNGGYSEEFPDVAPVSVHDQVVIEDFLTITA